MTERQRRIQALIERRKVIRKELREVAGELRGALIVEKLEGTPNHIHIVRLITKRILLNRELRDSKRQHIDLVLEENAYDRRRQTKSA